MDTKSEDTMVRQIEKNLTNHINESLLISGRAVEGSRITVDNNSSYEKPIDSTYTDVASADSNYPLVSYDYITNSPGLTRAEYIRQAREACLRQLSSQQLYSKPYEVNYMKADNDNAEKYSPKKENVLALYPNASGEEDQLEEDLSEEIPKEHEIAAYRSLIIRSICAILLFLCIFAFDKFNIKIGDFTDNMIKEYVTGNDALKNLENFLVTWLK